MERREDPPKHPMFPEARGRMEADARAREARVARFKEETEGLEQLVKDRLKEFDRAEGERDRFRAERALRKDVEAFLKDRRYVLTSAMDQVVPSFGFELVISADERKLTVRLYEKGTYVEIDYLGALK